MGQRSDARHILNYGNFSQICPGRHLVHSSVWVLIASMMATLNISKAVDDHGNVIEPEVAFENAVFRCDFYCGCYIGNLPHSLRQDTEPI
jgi:hypothetical protein